MKPSYIIVAFGPKTAMEINLPVYDVPELDKTVKQSAQSIAKHLRSHGWTGIGIAKAA